MDNHWCRLHRIASNGRFEVQCVECDNWFWLTLGELGRWAGCPHCYGWWELPD